MFDNKDFDEQCLLCLYDNGKVYYIIVQREPELKNTGLSIINRILNDRHKFIGDFYSTQSYFSLIYIDDDTIKVDKSFGGSNRNELTIKELDNYLIDEIYPYIYVYDVEKDSLIIKEPNKDLYHLDFYDRSKVEQFVSKIKKDKYSN